jgi:peptidoglycan/LPS O-acetylase OafA/YrhL
MVTKAQVAPDVLQAQRTKQLPENLETGLHYSHLPALDGLRAVAVGLVILYHFGFSGAPGGLGVLAFFVLSGFLITWLLVKENDARGTISIRNFYKRRVLRIFPAFYFYWLACACLLILNGSTVDWGDAASALVYLSNYYQGLFRPADSFVSHTWSLAIEEQFYLLWPLFLWLGRRNLKRTAIVLSVTIVTIWFYRATIHFYGVDQGYTYRAFETRVDHLLIGCLLAIVLSRRLCTGLWSWLCSKPYLPLVTVLLLAVSSHLDKSFTYRNVIGFSVNPILVALLIAQLIALHSTRPWSWLELAPIRYLGAISYSLYLYQQVALHPVRRMLAAHPEWLQLLAGVAVTILAAAFSYHFIEKPFLALKERSTRKETGTTFDSTAATLSPETWAVIAGAACTAQGRSEPHADAGKSSVVPASSCTP